MTPVTFPLDTISSRESSDIVNFLPALSSSESTSNWGRVTEKLVLKRERSCCSTTVSQDRSRNQVRMASLLRGPYLVIKLPLRNKEIRVRMDELVGADDNAESN